MKNSEIRYRAKSDFKMQWGSLLLAIAMYSAIVIAANAIPVVGAFIVAGPLTIGLYIIYTAFEANKEEKVDLWKLFKGFELNFGESFLLYILKGLYTALWSLLFIVPGIIKGISYSMSYFIMVKEPEISASAAIEKSMEYMKGNKGKYFKLMLSFLGWDILELLTCGLLCIYVEPYKMCAKVLFFEDVYENYGKVPAFMVQEESEAVICPSCGRKVSKNDTFCPGCGTNVKANPAKEEAAAGEE